MPSWATRAVWGLLETWVEVCAAELALLWSHVFAVSEVGPENVLTFWVSQLRSDEATRPELICPWETERRLCQETHSATHKVGMQSGAQWR